MGATEPRKLRELSLDSDFVIGTTGAAIACSKVGGGALWITGTTLGMISRRFQLEMSLKAKNSDFSQLLGDIALFWTFFLPN